MSNYHVTYTELVGGPRDGDSLYFDGPGPKLVEYASVLEEVGRSAPQATRVVRYLRTSYTKMRYWPQGCPPPCEATE